MNAVIRELASQHGQLRRSRDEALAPFLRIRQQRMAPPADALAIASPLLDWLQERFLPHLRDEETMLRPQLARTPRGEELFESLRACHNRLRKLADQTREEMMLLIEDSGIRDAWWDTLDISTLWAFENAMDRHFEYESKELLPAATALCASDGAQS